MDITNTSLANMNKFAAKIKATPLSHNNITLWRSRALKIAINLYKDIYDLNEDQTSDAISLCCAFMRSFWNSEGGHYEVWGEMKADYEERLEMLQEEEGDDEEHYHAHECEAGFMLNAQVQMNEIFNMGDHKMQVRVIMPAVLGHRRITLSCAPHCCTAPFHITTTMVEQELLKCFPRWRK
jgi:hypothetical protein